MCSYAKHRVPLRDTNPAWPPPWLSNRPANWTTTRRPVVKSSPPWATAAAGEWDGASDWDTGTPAESVAPCGVCGSLETWWDAFDKAHCQQCRPICAVLALAALAKRLAAESAEAGRKEGGKKAGKGRPKDDSSVPNGDKPNGKPKRDHSGDALAIAGAAAEIEKDNQAAAERKKTAGDRGKEGGRGKKKNPGVNHPRVLRDESNRTTSQAAKAAGVGRQKFERATVAALAAA
jgi:hypothetical protein